MYPHQTRVTSNDNRHRFRDPVEYLRYSPRKFKFCTCALMHQTRMHTDTYSKSIYKTDVPTGWGEQTSNIKTAYYLECNMPSLKVLPSTTTYSKHRQMPTLSPMHLCTYALKHLSTSELPADKQIGRQGQKNNDVTRRLSKSMRHKNGNHSPCVTTRQLLRVLQDSDCTPRVTEDNGRTTCHKRRRYTPRVTKDYGTPRVTKDDGTHHVSQKTTVHT